MSVIKAPLEKDLGIFKPRKQVCGYYKKDGGAMMSTSFWIECWRQLWKRPSFDSLNTLLKRIDWQGGWATKDLSKPEFYFPTTWVPQLQKRYHQSPWNCGSHIIGNTFWATLRRYLFHNIGMFLDLFSILLPWLLCGGNTTYIINMGFGARGRELLCPNYHSVIFNCC